MSSNIANNYNLNFSAAKYAFGLWGHHHKNPGGPPEESVALKENVSDVTRKYQIK